MRNLRGPHCSIAGEVVVKLHYSPAYKEESDSMDAQTSLSLTKAPFPHTGIVQRIDGGCPPLLIRETSLRIPSTPLGIPSSRGGYGEALDTPRKFQTCLKFPGVCSR